MKEIRITVLVVGVILAAVVLSNALYTVNETQQVVVTQFGNGIATSEDAARGGEQITEPLRRFRDRCCAAG